MIPPSLSYDSRSLSFPFSSAFALYASHSLSPSPFLLSCALSRRRPRTKLAVNIDTLSRPGNKIHRAGLLINRFGRKPIFLGALYAHVYWDSLHARLCCQGTRYAPNTPPRSCIRTHRLAHTSTNVIMGFHTRTHAPNFRPKSTR